MSRPEILINEIRKRLDELESLLNPSTVPKPTVDDPPNFQLSDSILKLNGIVFKITTEQIIELCKFIVNTTETQINIKPFVETINHSRCKCYCIVKEIERRDKFLTEGENLYYDEIKKKYYSQCRMPSISNNNYCNRHTAVHQIDVSRMKILTNSSYNLTVDSIIQTYCRSYLPDEISIDVPPKPAPVKKITIDAPPKPAPVKKITIEASKLIENSDIESGSDSENESCSELEVDIIVSKVSESLKHAPTEDESISEQDDSDDYMLDADEIHDEDGKTYYIDESKSVIKLDEKGYGVRIGMLKEFKSGTLFYKNKRWKIDYFPKK